LLCCSVKKMRTFIDSAEKRIYGVNFIKVHIIYDKLA
jgi:hypothetical protein